MQKYEKMLEYATKLKIEYRVIFIFKIMKSISREIDKSIEEKKNPMLTSIVNHRILKYISVYSNVLDEIYPTNEETDIDLSGFNNLLNGISLEDKLLLVYNLMENVCSSFVANMLGDCKFPDIVPAKICADKKMLEVSKEYLQEFATSIEIAKHLEYKSGEEIDLGNSGAYILR